MVMPTPAEKKAAEAEEAAEKAHQAEIARIIAEGEKVAAARTRLTREAERELEKFYASGDTKRYWINRWNGIVSWHCAYCPADNFDEAMMVFHQKQVHGVPDEELGPKRFDRFGRVLDPEAGAIHHTEPDPEEDQPQPGQAPPITEPVKRGA